MTSKHLVAVTTAAVLLWVYIAQKELWCWLFEFVSGESELGLTKVLMHMRCGYTMSMGFMASSCPVSSTHQRANVRMHQLIQRPEVRSVHNELMWNSAQV